MSEVTVPVPDDRVAEFYQFFGLWLAGGLSLSRGVPETSETSEEDAPRIEWGDTEQDLADAEVLWKKYSSNARALFSVLIDNPEKEFTGDELAAAAGIPNGSHGVAGVLAWPGRHGWKLARNLPSGWRQDEDTSEGYYRIKPNALEVFKAARAKVEGTA